MLLDDGFDQGDTQDMAHDMSETVKQDLLDSGFFIKG